MYIGGVSGVFGGVHVYIVYRVLCLVMCVSQERVWWRGCRGRESGVEGGEALLFYP